MVQINGGILLADGPAATITASLVYASSSQSNYQGVLAGVGNSLTVNNPAALLILSGTGLYTGGAFVNAGILAVTTSTALPENQSLTVGAGGTPIFGPLFSGSPIMASSLSPLAASSAAAGLPVSPVPEPSTLAQLFAGLVVGFGAWRRKRIACQHGPKGRGLLRFSVVALHSTCNSQPT